MTMMTTRHSHLLLLPSLFLLLLILIPPTSSQSSNHVIFTFEYINGSLVPVATNPNNPSSTSSSSNSSSSSSSSGLSGAVVQSIFLALLFLTGFCLSAMLIATVLSSLTLRRLPFNVLLMQIGLACLLECATNIVVSTLYAVRVQPWDALGDWACQVNAFTMEGIPVLYTLILLLLSVDRAVALRDPLKYRKSIATSLTRRSLIIILCWVVAAGSAAALAAGALQTWPFPVRYSCQVMDENSLYYAVVTGILCYILPWIGIGTAWAHIHSTVTTERMKERKTMRNNNNNNNNILNRVSTHTQMFFANAQLWKEMRNVMIVFALTLFYVLMVVPYIIRNKVDQCARQYDYSYYRNLTMPYYQNINATDSGVSIVTFPTTVVVGNNNTISTTTTTSTSTSTTTTMTGNASSSTTMTSPAGNVSGLYKVVPTQLPEVTESFLGVADSTLLVWLRYVHASVAIIIVFSIHKDLRKKGKDLLCCWIRPNSVESHNRAPGQDRPVSAFIRKQRKETELKKKKFRSITNYNVPVLFATSDGLHLRTATDSMGLPPPHPPSPPPTTKTKHKKGGKTKTKKAPTQQQQQQQQWALDPQFLMEFCDLQIPHPAAAAAATAAAAARHKRGQGDGDSFGSTVNLLKTPNAIWMERQREEDEETATELEKAPLLTHQQQQEKNRKVQFNSKIEEIPTTVKEEEKHKKKHKKHSSSSSSSSSGGSSNGSGGKRRHGSKKDKKGKANEVKDRKARSF